MDEEYDAVLEKEISELNEDEKGEVESIQVTNVAPQDGEAYDEGEEIIRLRIKRKIKKEKFRKNV